MTHLSQALQAAPWRLILVIGRQRGLGLDSRLDKNALITKIIPHLNDLDNLTQALSCLSVAVRQALFDLQQVGGRCPARHLRQSANNMACCGQYLNWSLTRLMLPPIATWPILPRWNNSVCWVWPFSTVPLTTCSFPMN